MEIIKLNQNTNDVVAKAVAVLAAGGLVIFPTETVYGAGVDATNQKAVDKLLAYKARREGKPLSIAVTGLEMAQQFVEVNDSARRIYQRFLPGPVTVVSKSLGKVANGVASEFGTLGIRMPDFPLVAEMVKHLNKPVTATSANGSGEKRPYTIQEIFDGLSDKQKSLIDLVIDAGTLPPNPPSTVIDTTLSTPVTLRQGEIDFRTNQPSLELTSNSEPETKAIAARILLKNWEAIKNSGLVIGLNGPLGAGKTIFTKGAAEFLMINETISSPTYTYMEEYDFERHHISGQLHHLDLWKIDSQEALERLEIAKLLHPKTVIVIEWWNQVEKWLQPMIAAAQIPLVTVTITDPHHGTDRILNIIGFEK